LAFGFWNSGFKSMYICADIDAFFVSVEQVLNPLLIGKPVVVGGLPHERGVVASASYEARKFGIHSGMPTAQAYRLCPRAIFLRGDFFYYDLYSKRFYEVLSHYSPDVEMVSIDEAYVNIKGTRRLFGFPPILAQKMKHEIRANLNLSVSLGIARTKVFSKIACEKAKPNGILFVHPDEEKKFLLPLGVDVLPGIGPRHLEILKNLNINTVEELLKASDWVLNTALGSHSRIIRFLISGGDFQSRDTIKSVSRETTLSEDTRDRELLHALFQYLVECGCNTLRRKGLVATTLTIKIRYSDFKTVSRRTKVFGTNAQQKIFEYGLPMLDNLLEEKKRIRLIGVCLSGLGYDGLQSLMFAVKEERLNRLNYALDRARLRFGFDCLFPANTIILKEL